MASAVSIFVGWGKNKQIFEDYGKRLDELEEVASMSLKDRELIRTEMQKVTFTLWGPTGNNGMSTQVKEILEKVVKIEKMSSAEEARRQGAMEAGHEERIRGRRREDRILRSTPQGDSDGNT